jgi:predicted acylesterase/phospholipase RssA
LATSDPTNTAGLVLSGGGAFGAYEVGVINVLCNGRSPATNHTPLDATVFSGTSVGGFNAAVLAMNVGGPVQAAATLNHIWLNTISDKGDGRGNSVYRIRGDVANYLDPRIPGLPMAQLGRVLTDAGAFGSLFARSAAGFLSTHGSLLSRAASQVDISVLMNTEPFERLVRDNIKPAALQNSGKTLTVTTTSWRSGRPTEFSFSDLNDEQTWAAIRASAAIPSLFPAILFPNKAATVPEYYVDGGTVLNTPISPVIRLGARAVHIISLTPHVSDGTSAYTGTTFDIFGRMLLAVVQESILQNMQWVDKMNDVFRILGPGEATDRIWQKLVATDLPPQHITVHRYFPKKALGGMAGMLNFDLSSVRELIAQGEKDAAEHDCTENMCIKPRPAMTVAS